MVYIIVFIVVDKVVITGTGLEGEAGDGNCTLTELDRKDIKCRNISHQAGG
jgi:hypothetical protein